MTTYYKDLKQGYTNGYLALPFLLSPIARRLRNLKGDLITTHCEAASILIDLSFK